MFVTKLVVHVPEGKGWGKGRKGREGKGRKRKGKEKEGKKTDGKKREGKRREGKGKGRKGSGKERKKREEKKREKEGKKTKHFSNVERSLNHPTLPLPLIVRVLCRKTGSRGNFMITLVSMLEYML